MQFLGGKVHFLKILDFSENDDFASKIPKDSLIPIDVFTHGPGNWKSHKISFEAKSCLLAEFYALVGIQDFDHMLFCSPMNENQ